MTTWIIERPEDIKKYIKFMIESIKKNDKEVLISSDLASGTTKAPDGKKTKNYRSLPFALSPTCLTLDGNNNFIMGNYAGVAFFILPKGSVRKPNNGNSKNNIASFFKKEQKVKVEE